jgi:hypothetical protein
VCSTSSRADLHRRSHDDGCMIQNSANDDNATTTPKADNAIDWAVDTVPIHQYLSPPMLPTPKDIQFAVWAAGLMGGVITVTVP